MSWTQLINPVSNLLDKFIADKDERDRLAHEIATLAERQSHEVNLAQIEVNKQEAKHGSIFVAGWRPAMGWVCVLGFGVAYILIPLVSMIYNINEGKPLDPYDLGELTPILVGMLGLGVYRTYETRTGVARGRLSG